MTGDTYRPAGFLREAGGFGPWDDEGTGEFYGEEEPSPFFQALMNPSLEERARRYEVGLKIAQTSEAASIRRRARNSPRGPFEAHRSGHDAPPRCETGAALEAASRPVAIEATEREGRRIVAVHPVTLEAGDWEALQSMGYRRLHVVKHGVSVGAGNRSVAKLIAAAQHHERVVFRDGDRFNLLRSNLVVIPTSLFYRATGHYPQLLSDGRHTVELCDGRRKTKRKAWGLSPQQRLGTIMFPAEPITPVKHGPAGARRSP